jgi:SpoVK/Ycf46/Vps4 family AAA+-type ATPase
MYVGWGLLSAGHVSARRTPCIIFIDEFDGIGRKARSPTGGDGAIHINQLLTEMDGFDDNTGATHLLPQNKRWPGYSGLEPPMSRHAGHAWSHPGVSGVWTVPGVSLWAPNW